MDEPQKHNLLRQLTKKEISKACSGISTLRRSSRKTRKALVDDVVAETSPEVWAAIAQEVKEKVQHKQRQYIDVLTGAKRKAGEEESDDDIEDNTEGRRAPGAPTQFLQPPTEEDIDHCYREFYDRTSAKELQSNICSVCARRVHHFEDRNAAYITAKDVHNAHLLQPKEQHKLHDLTEGMLLDKKGIRLDDDGKLVSMFICSECQKDLRRSKNNLPPRFSLANNLWIGQVPEVLKNMTIPEQMLVSLLYTRVFTLKLYPRAGYGGDPSTLQNGVRGNICSYPLHSEGIASMVTGKFLPRSCAILPSLISVTFIGPKGLPMEWKRHLLRVRRGVIRTALAFLKTHNRHYRDITIDVEALMNVPEDDVPRELLDVVKHSTDMDLLQAENDNYVESLRDIADSSADASIGIAGLTVLPIEIAGAVDVDLSAISYTDLLQWGMSNLNKESVYETAYGIRHGSQAASTWTRVMDAENFVERAFPCLFPYGEGGINRSRPVYIDTASHVRYLLKLGDRRFGTHETFPFVMFNSLIRQQAFLSCDIQMRRVDFLRDCHALATINQDMLREAVEEEKQQKPISNAAVRKFRRHVTISAGRMQGSDQSRYRWKSQIWSMCLIIGTPAIWMTINPSDLHDPIAQVLCGVDIDLDNFCKSAGPDRHQRAQNIAADPQAASEFFHFIVNVILETIVGVRVDGSGHKLDIRNGAFGRVSGYFGVVEAQGRGTLHLHLLLWLENSPTPDVLRDLLKSPTFRERVKTYLDTVFRAQTGSTADTANDDVPTANKEISFSRPIHPDTPNFQQVAEEFERDIARTEQYHTCHANRCLVIDKHDGRLKCKRRAPFDLSDETWVDEHGNWGMKRDDPHMNAWAPIITRTARCNNDGKLLTNGSDTKNLTFYICGYMTKKQGASYNLSALMEQGYEHHISHPRTEYSSALQKNNRLMLYRALTAISKEKEFSGPLVISYLSDKGVVYRSHTSSVIYWAAFVGHLLSVHPNLKTDTSTRKTADATEILNVDDDDEDNVLDGCEEEDNEEIGIIGQTSSPDNDDGNGERVIIELDDTGKIYAKSQVTDYMLRPHSMNDWSVLNFFVHSYEEDIPKGQMGTEEEPLLLRQKNARGRYQEGHPSYNRKRRVVRSVGHRNMPDLIGTWPPRNDDAAAHDFYCASILTLLKPWRDMKHLKGDGETWETAFQRFQDDANAEVKMATSAIQFPHDCKTSADTHRRNAQLGREQPNGVDEKEDFDDDVYDDEMDTGRYSEEELRLLKKKAAASNDAVTHGTLAVAAGRAAGFFADAGEAWKLAETSKHGTIATEADLQKAERWKAQMTNDIRSNDEQRQEEQRRLTTTNTIIDPSVEPLDHRMENTEVVEISQQSPQAEPALEAVDINLLHEDQRRAYDIVVWHLEETLAGRRPPTIRMLLIGEGGTGKSKIIQCLTNLFQQRNCASMLVKSAYTGIAASIISGKTTHKIGGIPVRKSADLPSGPKRQQMEELWAGKEYLIIDEISMISRRFLGLLSRNITIAKTTTTNAGAADVPSFGGINVILVGDFHQFPPVAGQGGPLYYPLNAKDKDQDVRLGRKVYEEFQVAVILTKQMRNSDAQWARVLSRLRKGEIIAKDISFLRTLVLGDPSCPHTDFSKPPWSTALLVTPRHGVRKQWNAEALRKWCTESGNVLYNCTAEDSYRGAALTARQRYGVVGRQISDSQSSKSDLPEVLDIAIGMKVMVTENVETDLDIANGARGTVQDIIFHPEEQFNSDPSCFKQLTHLPICILVKMDRTRTSQLEGLESNVVPIWPRTQKLNIHVEKNPRESVQQQITRKQFPMTAAYAFTDYRAQGQTLPYVIVDVATPPTGGLTLFNLYVALSRSISRNNVRILRDFDERWFYKHHDNRLADEDERLDALDRINKAEWMKKR